MTGARPAFRYRPDIDGLRALAVVPVCFFHIGVPVFPGGFVGVDIFFVISGFLMASLIGRELTTGSFVLTQFYERRARRILPALFVMLLFCAVMAVFAVPPKLFRDFGATLTATALFTSNIIFWRKQSNYFDVSSDWSPLLHTWSLGIEEQFYILFPLFLLAISHVRKVFRQYLIGITLLSSFALCVWGTKNAPTATFYLLPTRAWELLIGALVASWPLGPTQKTAGGLDGPQPFMVTAGVLGLLCVFVSLLAFDREMPFPGAAALLPCAGAALLLHSGTDGRGPVVWLLSIPPLRFIGRISYSLYLWHWPLIVFWSRYLVAPEPQWITRLVLIAVAVLFAWMSWRWVEQPFRTKSQIWGQKRIFAVSAMGMLLFGVGGLLVATSSGWPSRFAGIESVSMDQQMHEEGTDLEWTQFNEAGCFIDDVKAWRAEACFLTHAGKENVLLWGDSFAASYAYGFFRTKVKAVNVLEYTSPQCPPLIGYEAASRPQCEKFNEVVGDIVKKHHISTVIMAANWTAYIKRRKLQLSDIEKTIEYLHALSVRVVLVGQSPVFDFAYPDDYFFKVYGTQSKNRIYYAPPDVHATINVDMESATRADAFFDPLAHWCGKEGCVFRQGSSYLYSDYGHFTHMGSVLAVSALLGTPNLLQ